MIPVDPIPLTRYSRSLSADDPIKRTRSPGENPSGGRASSNLPVLAVTLEIDRTIQSLEVTQGPEGKLTVQLDGEAQDIALEPSSGDGLYRLRVGDRTMTVHIARVGSGLRVSVGARQYDVSVLRGGLQEGVAFTDGGRTLSAPMAGSIAEVLVAEGDKVLQGDPLLVIVAMKMNNEIRSPLDAVVRTVHVAAGESVEQGALLVALEALEQTEASE